MWKKGDKPWNYGLTKETDIRVKYLGESISDTHQTNHKLKGKSAWNKGLTKEVDSKMKQLSNSLIGNTPHNKGKFIINNREELFTLYWDNLMSIREIAKFYNTGYSNVARAFRRLNIDRRAASDRTKLAGRGGRSNRENGYWSSDKKYEHRTVYSKEYNCELNSTDIIHHKDFDKTNNHYLNLDKVNHSQHSIIHKNDKPNRIPIYEIYLRMAELLSGRSTCIRMKTGAVITSSDLSKVYSVGYNGNVLGGVNSCNGVKGECECIHAEENALLKVCVDDKNKVLFCTHSPCKSCAKKIIQSGFSYVFYREEYRDKTPITFLHFYGIKTCKYILWSDYN